MENLQNEIQAMVGLLPEAELKIVYEVISRFVPDYIATTDDLEHIAMARKEFENGGTVNADDLDWG